MGKLYGLIGLTALVAGIATNLAFANSSGSGLKVCNKGERGTAVIAIAYPAGKNAWRSEGWLTLKEGECGTLLNRNLTNRYYYYYATTDNNYTWGGKHPFCISSEGFAFTDADKQCNGLRSRWENFRELDTGKDTTAFTLNLQ
ncbi:DUF1036 domain-containing protein [Kovacikia minuta CCNUW1]|uniref:DUF1036 domain-containing protein n=1 Tax=Kovacikia minuta TaxID=2931930 RepID=UPI001CCDB539|nr:DUF1036 domain-containing protein [Kovacikia minuta]UBF26749.1 DUF1036 domain-containing protein [Kovacikia minuta CCNUW1]